VGKVAHFRDIEGLSGSRIEPGSPEQTALYNALPIVVNVHGSFASLARFLYRLEAMDRLVRIEEMTIEADTDQTPTQVDVMLRMSIYHRHAEI
jgi:Tfp pilus assembly protein PilO